MSSMNFLSSMDFLSSMFFYEFYELYELYEQSSVRKNCSGTRPDPGWDLTGKGHLEKSFSHMEALFLACPGSWKLSRIALMTARISFVVTIPLCSR